MQTYLGSTYINDFNYLGRTFEVMAQADGPFRDRSSDIARLKTRNASGAMVPIGTVARFATPPGRTAVPRYNLYPAAEVQGATAPGVSLRGRRSTRMERLARSACRPGIGFEWTELAYQQEQREHRAADLRRGGAVRLPGAGGAV